MITITTRSGVVYEGPSIPTNPSLYGVERENIEDKDISSKKISKKYRLKIPPPVILISIPEPDVPKTLPKTTPISESDIPKSLPNQIFTYPSRRDDQKSRDKAFELKWKDLPNLFKISLSTLVSRMLSFDAKICSLRLRRCSSNAFRKAWRSLGGISNKSRSPGLGEKLLSTCPYGFRVPSHALACVLLPGSFNGVMRSYSDMIEKTMEVFMDDFSVFGDKLADRSITRPKGLVEDIFVKVGNFHFPTDFVVVDFEADPRVPLILGRSFLRTSRALIDVYEGELVLRDGNEQITFHVNGTSKHPQKHENESIKMVNDACKDSFKKFTDEPALVCLTPPEDVNDEKEKQEVKNLAEPTVKRQTRITPCLKNFKVICKESIFHSNKPPQVSLVFAITSTLPSIEPKDSLIMGDEHLSTFSDEEIVPIPRESEDISRSDSKNVLPSCDDFSSIKDPRDDSVTFSNNLFEFDVNLNSSDINPLFDEVIASILEGFIDEQHFEENDDLFDLKCKTNDWKGILYDVPINEAECFDPGGDNDEIDAFLAIEVPTYIEEGYYDSEGDVIYLESLLSDDNTHNLSPEVFFNHEPQHDTFSPKSDPLHHEFTGELITIPLGIVREHEDYINRMSLLCGNSSSQSPENFHTIIESLPTSTTEIEDSDSNREEIDIFSRPDDSISPGIESDFDSEEDNLPNDDPIPEYERLTFDMEPDVPAINNVDELNEDECFDPGGAYENSLIYKERTKKLHDSKIKNRIFNVGDRVLLFNSRLKIFSGKLKTRWSGPFTITKVFPYGTIELSQPDGPNFKVNGHRVKHYFGGDLPPKVVQDLHTLSKDE
ncbi:reverse transcriptase domain-containing protein [Tanacetum coccineum]